MRPQIRVYSCALVVENPSSNCPLLTPSLILFVSHVLHPIDNFSIERFYTNLEEMQWKWHAPTDAGVSREAGSWRGLCIASRMQKP